MKGYFYVTDYEHEGDIRRDMARVKEVDPTATILRTDISKEDPEADCETCEVTIEFDPTKAAELEKAISSFSFYDTVVYVTKTGKSYKLKEDKRWNIPMNMSVAGSKEYYEYGKGKL